MKILIYLLILYSALFGYEIEHFLIPKDGKVAEASLIDSILESNKTIDIAMFMLTNKKLTNALKKRAQKGNIDIRVIVDFTMNKPISKSSKAKHLVSKKNIKLYTVKGLPKKDTKKKKNRHGIMHSKLMIIDKEIVYMGSANWTNSAFMFNYELLIKIVDKTTAKLYTYYYEDILLQTEVYIKETLK